MDQSEKRNKKKDKKKEKKKFPYKRGGRLRTILQNKIKNEIH